MKKLFTFLTIVSAIAFSSCDNETSENPRPMGIAKLSGTVYADFDWSEDGEDEVPVANKKVLLFIYSYDEELLRTIEGTTDANGQYAFEIEVGNEPVYADINLVDFRQSVKKNDDTTEEEIFYGNYFEFDGPGWVELHKGGEYIRDVEYD